MTVHEDKLEPRVVTTRRYEFTLPGDHRVADFDELVAVRDRVFQWLRAVPLELDVADVVVRYAHDGRLVVAYEEVPTLDRPATVVTETVEALRDELTAALDVRYHAPWEQLLDVVRNRTALARIAARAVNDGGGDPLILALLPRDWPRRLDAQVANAGNQLGLLGLIKRQIDGWVLAAEDVAGVTTTEVTCDAVDG